MMFPRRVPFIGEVPLPMISSWPRSLISATSAQTFDVPMSRATMYFSSVLDIRCLLMLFRHAAHNDSFCEPQVRVLDLRVVVRAQDGAEVPVFRGDVFRVRVDDRLQLAVVQCKAARRDR